MGPIRVLIEGFLRGRYGYEGHRALWVLALPLLIGAFLVAGWLLVVPLLTIPRFTTEGPVVRNGVAAVVVCGKKGGPMNEKGMMAVSDHAPEPRTGGWCPLGGASVRCGTTAHRVWNSATTATSGRKRSGAVAR